MQVFFLQMPNKFPRNLVLTAFQFQTESFASQLAIASTRTDELKLIGNLTLTVKLLNKSVMNAASGSNAVHVSLKIVTNFC